MLAVDPTTETQERVDQYIAGVLDGSIPAGRYIRLAVERHVRDLETGVERGLVFSPDAAQIVVDFFGLLHHFKGKWAGRPICLEPWQLFVVWITFGWMRTDGTRRFRVAYTEVARKNGKSTLAAGIGLYCLVADGEQGAEVYPVARLKKQAYEVLQRTAEQMVRRSPSLRKRLQIYKTQSTIVYEPAAAKMEPLGSDSENLDGLNVHTALIDELHAHRDRTVWDVIDSAMGSRTQPLIFAITTAGFNPQSFCYLQRDYTIKVLEGVVQDDTWAGFIWTIDEGDAWKDEGCWAKANPNLGVSVNLEDMRRMAHKAAESPGDTNNFLTKRLDVWTNQVSRWVNLDTWRTNAGPVNEDDLVGRPCWSGLDLSTNTDITAFVHVFEVGDKLAVVPRFWIPEDNAKLRERRDRVPYVQWAKQGLIRMTPGNVIDHKAIRADILADSRRFGMVGMGFDRWNFEGLRQALMDEGVPEKLMTAVGMGYASMSAPMKKLEELYLAGKLVGLDHPVLLWMASNVSEDKDPAGNIKPNKEKSGERIDGIVALILAICMHEVSARPRGSVYDERGAILL